jgi:dTDP-4-amino-4,6-dideoxygalactose transaminase
MEKTQNDLPILEVGKDNIVLFHPHIPKNAVNYVSETLSTRWIGQGPKVEKFENEFSGKFCEGRTAVAVGAGTDALHLAYILAGLKPGDEIISPVFTCTATNIPFLYMGVKVIFADVDKNTLNISVEQVRR